MAPTTTRGLSAILPLILAACANPDLVGSPERDRLAARRALAEAAKAGPVPLVTAGDPGPLAPGELPSLAARGIVGLSPTFTPAAPAAVTDRLVLWFGPPPDAAPQAACAGTAPPRSVPTSPPTLLAVWCDDLHPVASVSGTAADAGRAAAERLVWQTTSRLFPDDYGETYGLNLFGWRVRLRGERQLLRV